MSHATRPNRTIALQDMVRASVCALALIGTGILDLNKPARGEEIRIGGTGGALGTIQILADAYNKSQSDAKVVVVPNLGSSGGIRAVIAGAIQIGLSGRLLKDAELSQGAKEIEYGRTPFVFATSVNNAGVAAITTPQLVEIYSGRMERWSDGTKIRLVLRPENDSDTESVRKISPELNQAALLASKRSGMLVAVTDHDAADYLEKLSGSVGTTTLAMILSEKRSLKALKLNGAEPSVKGIAQGSYPYYKQMMLVTGPKTPLSATRFIAFVQSPAGRQILARTGHWVN
jgi:phosphate transport system substrate-binding protein